MKIVYKAIFWIAKHLPDVIAIPIGEWLQKQLQKERKKVVLDKLADFLLQEEKKAKRK